MSAPRPWGATASTRLPGMEPDTGVRTRSYSLSSGSSTASLVSVLNHESCESLGSDSDDDWKQEQPKQQQPKKSRKTKVLDSKKTNGSHQNNGYPGSSEVIKTPEPAIVLTPKTPLAVSWDDWVIQKAKEERKQIRRELRRKEKEREKEERAALERKQQLQKGEGKIKDWMEKKSLEKALRQKSASRQVSVKKEIEEEKKKDVCEKEAKAYKEWAQKKKEQDKQKKKDEEAKQKQEDDDKQERDKKAQAAFDEWCKQSSNRPKSASNSFGYTSGKLTGYHDKGAYPSPTFCNPLPWVPVEVPKAKPQKNKAKSKYKWNPSKYL